jgi:hypothetical protein
MCKFNSRQVAPRGGLIAVGLSPGKEFAAARSVMRNAIMNEQRR